MSKTLAQLIADPTQGVVNAAMGEQADAESKSVVLSTGSKALLAAVGTKLDSVITYVDGLETLIGTTNSNLTTLQGYVDGLEALIAATNTAIAATNAKMDTLNTAVASTTTPSPVIMSLTPKAIAASATDFVLGTTGAAGDSLEGVIIQPTGTTVGAVLIKDGSTTLYTYPGGTVTADLRPIVIPLGAACATAWKVTFPANATGIALGKFT